MAVDQTRARLIVKTRFMVQLGASRAREAVASRKTDYGGTVSVGGSKVSITGGVLYVVATPLGHLGDMTPRAITVLQGVDVIAAEDTRHSAPLLRHFDIATPTIALHEHNQDRVGPADFSFNHLWFFAFKNGRAPRTTRRAPGRSAHADFLRGAAS